MISEILSPVGIVPVAGTHAFRGGWWKDPTHPWAVMMAANGFILQRRKDGSAYRWSTALDGLFRLNDDWEAAADSLGDFLDLCVPYEHRNLAAHSHGGQPSIILAARGFPIRSLVTVGTPVRDDVPAAEAARQIQSRGGLWIHVYDLKRDWTQWLGSVGDGELRNRRRFNIPSVVNDGIPDIDHSGVFEKPLGRGYWKERGWLGMIRKLT
jgi:hypothetical protein